MKSATILLVSLLAVFSLLSSCTSLGSKLRLGSPIKAGYEGEAPGWASRNLPGVKTLSNLIPPPTDARMQWDEWQKKRSTRGVAQDAQGL